MAESYTVERLSDNARIVRKPKTNTPIFVSVGNIIIFKKDKFDSEEVGELDSEKAFQPRDKHIVILNPIPNFTEKPDDETKYLKRYAQSIAVLAYNQYIKKREKMFNNTGIQNDIENLKYTSSWLNKGEYWLQETEQWTMFLRHLKDNESRLNLLNDPDYLKKYKIKRQAGLDVELKFHPYTKVIELIHSYVNETVTILNPKFK